RALRAGGGALAALIVAVLVLGVVAVGVAIVLLRLFLDLAEIEVEILDELPGELAVGVLIADVTAELEEIAADLAFKERPPHLDDALRRGWRRGARQRLARQEPHRLGERRIVAIAHMLVALAAIALVEHRRQIVGDAR